MNAILVFIIRLILIVLCYIFVGWIGYTIFLDIKAVAISKRETIFPALTLQTINKQEELSKRFMVPEIIIGRDPACDFHLDDETVSLRHCKIVFHHNQWWVQDLDSTNGSFLNEVLTEGSIILADGDQLRLGKAILKVTINSNKTGENNG